MHNEYVFDPYPLSLTMERLAANVKARRLEKKLSTKTLAEMSGVPASSIQRFELKHSISLESYVKLAKALGYSEEIMQLLAEPKYDTMEELLEINRNKTRKRGVWYGRWRLSPAYDLTNDQTLGEHATTINFKGKPTDEDMITIGMNIKMSRQRCQQIIEEVRNVLKEDI